MLAWLPWAGHLLLALIWLLLAWMTWLLVLTWLAYSRGSWRLGFGLPKTAPFSLRADPT